MSLPQAVATRASVALGAASGGALSIGATAVGASTLAAVAVPVVLPVAIVAGVFGFIRSRFD